MQNNNTNQPKENPALKTGKEVVKKIPFLNLPDLPLVSTTQNEMPIADITEDMVLFKDGGAALVLESTSLNFGLLSEKEQQAVVYSYAALLNSLSFSIQILVRSQRKDISNYLTYLSEAATKITNPKLQVVMNSYRTFIGEIVKKKNVLGKRFFIVIPFSPLELGAKQSFSTITAKGPLPFPKSYIVKKAQIALFPKRDHLIRQAGRLSLRLTQLNTNQLIELFYDFYNPKAPVITKQQ
jgi:hypothetical protein